MAHTVLHLLWSFERGGAELLLLDLVRLADRARFRHAVCCLGPDGPLGAAYRAAGCETCTLGKSGRGDFLRVVARGAALVRRLNPSIVHIHRNGPDVWGQCIALLAGRGRVVVTEHGVYGDDMDPDLRIPWHRTLPRYLLRWQVARTMAISRAVAEDLRCQRLASPERTVVVHNGVDAHTFSPAGRRAAAAEPLRIGASGRLIPRKGFDVLIRAVALLRPKHPDLRVEMAGAGRERERLAALAADAGVADGVVLAGEQGDMPSFLRGLDLYILPSRREGFGLALVEAMSCGLPVVASGVDAVREIVQDGVNGLLVPPGDAAALAKAMERCLGDPALRERLGGAARATVEQHFTVEVMTRRYEEVYGEVLAGAAPRATMPLGP